jgi:predicted nucleotidyltransferase
MIPASLHLDDARLSDICRRYGVSKLSLFGSVLHGSSDAQSDVDILVEFPPRATPSLLELGALQQELADLMGREVDLKTPGFLSRYFRAQVLSEALPLYAA